jgi:hypothetical protein
MSWRVVVVSSNAKVDYKLNYLVVRTLNEVKRVHLSEIGVLILESTAISIASYLLCELLQRMSNPLPGETFCLLDEGLCELRLDSSGEIR